MVAGTGCGTEEVRDVPGPEGAIWPYLCSDMYARH